MVWEGARARGTVPWRTGAEGKGRMLNSWNGFNGAAQQARIANRLLRTGTQQTGYLGRSYLLEEPGHAISHRNETNEINETNNVLKDVI